MNADGQPRTRATSDQRTSPGLYDMAGPCADTKRSGKTANMVRFAAAVGDGFKTLRRLAWPRSLNPGAVLLATAWLRGSNPVRASSSRMPSMQSPIPLQAGLEARLHTACGTTLERPLIVQHDSQPFSEDREARERERTRNPVKIRIKVEEAPQTLSAGVIPVIDTSKHHKDVFAPADASSCYEVRPIVYSEGGYAANFHEAKKLAGKSLYRVDYIRYFLREPPKTVSGLKGDKQCHRQLAKIECGKM